MVDVRGHTPAHDINHREGDSQEPYILAEGNRYTEHELRDGSSHHDEDLKVKSFQRTVLTMMKAYLRAYHRRFMRKHSRPSLRSTSSFEAWHSDDS